MKRSRIILASALKSLLRAFFCLFTVAILLLTGCAKKSDTTSYDHLQSQLLADAMQAISRRNHELALVKLEQLAELEPANEFLKRMIQREKEQLALRRIAVPLGKGNLDGAWAELRKAEVEIGRPPGLRRRRQQLEALQSLQRYRGSLPFEDADSAVEAIAALPESALLEDNPYYRRWQHGQERAARTLQIIQQEEVGSELLDELDWALATHAPEVPAILAQIRTLHAESPLATRRFAEPKSLGDLDGRVFDLLCFLQAMDHDLERRAMILASFRDRRPFTYVGELLGIWADLQHGHPQRALNRFRVLQTAVPDLRRPPFSALLQQILQETTGDLTPSVHGVLEHLYRFQNPAP